MEILLTIIAAIFILFLPGFVLSLVFFAWKQIDMIERLALSFALSIAVVPLVVFYTNLLGVKITTVNVIFQVVGILLLSGGIILLKRIFKTKKHKI
jgi:uncharacterized membrane protein